VNGCPAVEKVVDRLALSFLWRATAPLLVHPDFKLGMSGRDCHGVRHRAPAFAINAGAQSRRACRYDVQLRWRSPPLPFHEVDKFPPAVLQQAA